ncbi:AAA family ATPase [Ignavibacterium sp.]|uniref:AAA family ATPase n=1 Tax=Ignavibacterium sp. TaxID=2651167 RepID=UPI00307D2A4D
MQDKNNNILESLKAFLDRKGYSINRVARQLGYSPAVLSIYLQGKYSGNNDKLEFAISSYLARQEEIEQMPRESIPFVSINNSKIVFSIARMCHNECEIGCIVGEAGTGKTRAIKEYTLQNPDVILLEADLSYTTKIFFKELSRKLGMDDSGGIYDLFTNCIDKLKDSGRLIIIDEAENLPYRALDMIRRLYDKANVGILLVGLPRLVSNLTGKRGEYKQLYSRVGFVSQLDRLTENDTRQIVQKVFLSSNGEYADFHNLAKGNMRKLEKLILRTKREIKSGKNLSPKLIKQASEMLIL